MYIKHKYILNILLYIYQYYIINFFKRDFQIQLITSNFIYKKMNPKHTIIRKF